MKIAECRVQRNVGWRKFRFILLEITVGNATSKTGQDDVDIQYPYCWPAEFMANKVVK